jgi:hypothetical protein
VAHGKRWTRLLTGAGIAVAAALAAAGCASTQAGTASRSTASGNTASGSTASARPAVTAAQARQVFDSYVATSDRAARTGDAALALSDVTGVQSSVLSAGLESTGHTRAALERYRYGTPAFYLPQPDGYPRWFAVSVQRTLTAARASAADEIVAGIAGARSTARGQVLMVFEQSSPKRPWRLASASQLASGESVPTVAADAGGHVPAVALSDTALLARPDVAGALQAAVADEGPASAAAQVVAAGPLTTGIYRAERASLLGLKAPRGDVYQWQLEGSNYTKFALRTADGGALVFYAMYLNTTVEVPAVLGKGVVKPGPPITVPGYLTPLLPPAKTAPRESLEAQQLLSFAAVDPPSGTGANGKIQVIAIGGGLNYATAS